MNMAIDEVMLADAASEGVASLRFYQWTEATVSLGYFQAAEARRGLPGLDGVALVRRASGGGALVHHHELTYGIALPAGDVWQRSNQSWLCEMHGHIRKALARFGVDASLCPDGGEKGRGETLCFRHHTPGDVLIHGHKVVGSSQRRQRGALLQHGAVLLAQSPYTPQLPGIANLVGVTIAASSLTDAIVAVLASDANFRFVFTPLDDGIVNHAKRLVLEKYAADWWNGKR
jgi:lipoate-protein ligase A